MKKLLVLATVLCFAGAASAATITFEGRVNEWGMEDADPLTNYINIHIDTGGVSLAGLDIFVVAPAGSIPTEDVLGKAATPPPLPPPWFPFGTDLASGHSWTDDRESWWQDGMLDAFIIGQNIHTSSGADGIVAMSGDPKNMVNGPWPYIYDNATAQYTPPGHWLSGGSTGGLSANGLTLLARIGYDNIAQLPCPLMAGVGPGGISVMSGQPAITDVVWTGCLTPEPTTMLLLMAGALGLIRRKR